MFKIELGARVKDQLTGFKGIVTARAEYLTGCRQYAVRPEKMTKEGKIRDSLWFDEDRLRVVGKLFKLGPADGRTKNPGGPSTEGFNGMHNI